MLLPVSAWNIGWREDAGPYYAIAFDVKRPCWDPAADGASSRSPRRFSPLHMPAESGFAVFSSVRFEVRKDFSVDATCYAGPWFAANFHARVSAAIVLLLNPYDRGRAYCATQPWSRLELEIWGRP
jgi:hypothetical protein